MNPEIDLPQLFKEKLETGINLFTGAGFSCLPNSSGFRLPIGGELSKEICSRFNIDEMFADDLETATTLAPKQELQEFLRNRYTITEYNELYDVLNQINMSSYITTNIDNIIHKVMDNSQRYYLSSITYYGATKREPNKLTYIPLHGDVIDTESMLYFGKFDLANVDKANSDLFHLMQGKLMEGPSVFLGYGFHDSGVLRTISTLVTKYSPQDIWVQCLPHDDKLIKVIRTLRCNVIIADTESLLSWIKINVPSPSNSDKDLSDKTILPEHCIPTLSKVEAISTAEFYQKGITHWYPILANSVPELDIVNRLYDGALKQKNVILVGGRFTGKTTALMQAAIKVTARYKFYITDLTMDKAKYVVTKIGSIESWVFIEDCSSDILAYKVIAQVPNIKIIGTAEEFKFESVKHLIGGVPCRVEELGELTRSQAQQIYDRIPLAIRTQSFRFKEMENERFSMLEMVSKNVKNTQTEYKVGKILESLFRSDLEAFDAVALTAYLSKNGSALTTDIIFSFFSNVSSYSEAKVIISKTQSLLSNYEIDLKKDEYDQDFFCLRSKLFALNAYRLLEHEQKFKSEFARVVKTFIENVAPFKIFRHDVFRRTAYDSEFFNSLFKSDSNEIYAYLYDYSENPYILQQWALCRALQHDFSQAFIDIDKDINKLPYNFSIKNSRAIILFEANRNKGTNLAISKMKEAMGILQECYSNDKRKVYHAQKFAEFALLLASDYLVHDYLNEAYNWLDVSFRVS